MPQGLREYGTGFVRGLTNVAQQQRADQRADEDRKARQALAILNLGLANPGSFDVAAFLEEQGPILGLGGAKGGKGKGGKGDPQSMIQQLLAPALGQQPDAAGGAAGTGQQGAPPSGATTTPLTSPGLGDLPGGGGPGGVPGTVPGGAQPAGGGALPPSSGVFLSPGASQARNVELQRADDEAFVARARLSGMSAEEIAEAMQRRAGKVPTTVQFGAAGATPFIDGEPGETLPSRPLQPRAPANLQLVQRNRPGDPVGAPPTDFLFDPQSGQLFNLDRTPVTEELESRRAPRQDPVQRFQRVTVRVGDSDDAIQANFDSRTGQYFDVDSGDQLTGVRPAPTADQRNKAAARKLVIPAITEIRKLSELVITHVGPRQRADALRRGAAAVLGSDPEWRTYRDARRALAGNLAVLQQGSRPSDADISAVWLPLVPDVFTDTTESAAMKWRLISVMSGLEAPTDDADAAPTNPFRN